MGKVIPFRRVTPRNQSQHVRSDDLGAIVNDDTLTAAQRHWLLEKMLAGIDEQLDRYQKELEKAERTLNALVTSAEQSIRQVR
jgi:hypothetical protein